MSHQRKPLKQGIRTDKHIERYTGTKPETHNKDNRGDHHAFIHLNRAEGPVRVYVDPEHWISTIV